MQFHTVSCICDNKPAGSWFSMFLSVLPSVLLGAVLVLFCKHFKGPRVLASRSVHFRWVCCYKWVGKLKIGWTWLSFVAPNLLSKCAEQILVCLVTFKLLKRKAATHFFLLSFSFIPGAHVLIRLSIGKVWNVNPLSSGYFWWFFGFSMLLEKPIGTANMFNHDFTVKHCNLRWLGWLSQYFSSCVEECFFNFHPHEPRFDAPKKKKHSSQTSSGIRIRSILNFIVNVTLACNSWWLFTVWRCQWFPESFNYTWHDYHPDHLFLTQSKCLSILGLTISFNLVLTLKSTQCERLKKGRNLVRDVRSNYRCVKFVHLSMSSRGTFFNQCSTFLEMITEVGVDKTQQHYIIKKMINLANRATCSRLVAEIRFLIAQTWRNFILLLFLFVLVLLVS